MVKKWMQKAFKKSKRGRLHKQLGVPQDKTLPVSFLQKIKTAKIGKTVRNPTRTGKRKVKVTGLLKKRAVLVLNAREARR